MRSARQKRLFGQVLPIGLIWLLTSWVFLWTEYALIGDIKNTPESAIAITPKVLFFASLSVFMVGIVIGLIEFTFLNKRFQAFSFLTKIIGKFLFYVVLMELIVFVTYLLAASIELEISIFHSKVWDKYLLFFYSITHLTTLIQLGFSLLLSLFYIEISENLGHSVLVNFFTGTYHKPKSEIRLFMFSDMKSSTQIAEQLGHVEYFEFLKSYYNELSDAILKHGGEVYQYVGDEIVLSWRHKQKDVALKSLNCFFDMKTALRNKQDYYLQRYGIYPDFKAAIHIGNVTTGEIGALKKAIFFTGDVLNTTARMQAECSTFNVDLIVSQNIVDGIGASGFYVSFLAHKILKGKQTSVGLYTIKPD